MTVEECKTILYAIRMSCCRTEREALDFAISILDKEQEIQEIIDESEGLICH